MSEVNDSRLPELRADDVPVGTAAVGGQELPGSSGSAESPGSADSPGGAESSDQVDTTGGFGPGVRLAVGREAPGDDGSEGGGRRSNRGVWIRAFIYVIGFHMFAGFVMLLFYFGNRNH